MTPLRNGRRIVVLADMLELGAEGPDCIGNWSSLSSGRSRQGPCRGYVGGTSLECAARASARPEGQSASALIPVLKAELADGDVILFKGSNGMGLSAVVQAIRDLGQRPGGELPSGAT